MINPTTASCATIGSGSAAVFLFDVGSDGVSDVTTIPFAFLAFLTGADLYIPTDLPGSVSVVMTPRGGGATRELDVPNTPSTEARMVVNFNDFD